MFRQPRNAANPISRVLYPPQGRAPIIYLRRRSPAASSNLPPTSDEPPLIVGIHGLATRETYCRTTLPPPRWALTPPFHPYPFGRFFSVTLLCPLEHQAVNLLGALCCPDFPPRPEPAAIERTCGAKIRKIFSIRNFRPSRAASGKSDAGHSRLRFARASACPALETLDFAALHSG